MPKLTGEGLSPNRSYLKLEWCWEVLRVECGHWWCNGISQHFKRKKEVSPRGIDSGALEKGASSLGCPLPQTYCCHPVLKAANACPERTVPLGSEGSSPGQERVMRLTWCQNQKVSWRPGSPGPPFLRRENYGSQGHVIGRSYSSISSPTGQKNNEPIIIIIMSHAGRGTRNTNWGGGWTHKLIWVKECVRVHGILTRVTDAETEVHRGPM